MRSKDQTKMGKKSRKPRGGGGGAKPSPPTGPFDGPLVDGVTNIMSYAMMVAEDAKGDITTERAYSGACLSRDVPSCDECWLEGVPLKRPVPAQDRKLAALPIWHKVHMVEPVALSLAI